MSLARTSKNKNKHCRIYGLSSKLWIETLVKLETCMASSYCPNHKFNCVNLHMHFVNAKFPLILNIDYQPRTWNCISPVK